MIRSQHLLKLSCSTLLQNSRNMAAKKRKSVKPEFEADDSLSQNQEKKQKPENQWIPPNWEEAYENLRTMRADRSAPCDQGKRDKSKYTLKEQRFHTLTGLMLSSQTKDDVTIAAMERLREHGCTVQNLLDTSDDKLGKLIYPVGFWRTKVKYIKGACQVLKDEYDSDIPRTVEGLCKLKGVGPKMAYLCMEHAWNDCVGIGVDTHVHRIAARMGWLEKECKTPEHTRKGLEAWLPKDRWREVNMLLVGFGQQICLPIGPKCGECLNRELCPTGQKWTPSPKKKTPTPKKKKA
eukprot:TRINITY_DN2070_c0_g1_i4.p1 TRINITY_DN2070_c0_g1~~TRINITY_DN2070_c0_g1_i4.p1  ORF type:complete len:293 (+),score=48.93 TRINITY_DN2070_c0_g1_i4:57-935(+)